MNLRNFTIQIYTFDVNFDFYDDFKNIVKTFISLHFIPCFFDPLS